MNKNSIMINFCKQQAQLSKCNDKKTAAILVSADMQQIYSIGINGGPRGGAQCLCAPENFNGITGRTKYSCVHAEMNCLVKNKTIDNVPKILICTKQPCAMCASLIINSDTNIKEVWYIEDYWDTSGVEILERAYIFVSKLTEYENNLWCFVDQPNQEV